MLLREFLESNTVERAIKTETTDTKNLIKWSGQARPGLCQRYKPQQPHHVKARPWGPEAAEIRCRQRDQRKSNPEKEQEEHPNRQTVTDN